MRNPLKSKQSKNIGRGPIARKVIASAQHHLQQKVTNLSDWRDAKIRAEDFQKTIISHNKLTEYDPVHGLYIYGQNLLSVLIEQLCELPMLDKLADAYAQAEEEYMPSGPPMSPLTGSYFTCWGAFDLYAGPKRETFGTIGIDLYKFLNVDEGLITLFEKMQASRMGIYKHDGTVGGYVVLRELITNREIKDIPASGYFGNPGEIWFARLMPPPFENNTQFDYSIVFTTPYVFGKSGRRKEFIPFVENDWLDYFKRNLMWTKIGEKEPAYEYLMKYGLSRNYWNEYVFLSYRNHQHDMILLEGFPDVPSSLPHS
jgi:hypothetical protein